MIKYLNTWLMLVMLSLSGQALAVADVCDHMMAESTPIVDHATMDHTIMNHSEMTSHDSSPDMMHGHEQVMDCCSEDCVCPANMCSSVQFMAVSDSDAYAFACHTAFLTTSQQQPVPNSSYRYRPPILV
jgi:hypothetical protein